MAATSSAASGIVLEALTKDNYENWSTLVRNYLMGQDLWEVVTGTLVPETIAGVQDTFVDHTWKMKNSKALHIIQLACGSQILTHIREVETAKEAWNKLRVSYSSKLKADPDIEQGIVDDSLLHNKQLHQDVLSGTWNEAKLIINEDQEAIYSTSSSRRTVLHIAVIAGHENIVQELVKTGKDKLVKIKDNCGYTALALAAELTGNTNIAKCIVEMRGGGGKDLLSMKTTKGEIPVLLAAAKAHKQMTRYLFDNTELEELDGKNFRNGFLLLTRCITAEIFDVALSLLQRIPDLPLALNLDPASHDLQPLYALACVPSAFPSGSGFGLLRQFFYKILTLTSQTPPKMKRKDLDTLNVIVSKVEKEEDQHKSSFPGRFCGRVLNFGPVKFLGQILLFVQNYILLEIPGLREVYDQKMTHFVALQILKCLYERVREFDESQLREASAYDAMLQAAKHGIIEFIDEMSKANPNLLWAIDQNRRGIFSHAIMNRRKAVFQLIHSSKVNGRKDIIRPDVFNNTLLHLAAYLGPSSDLDCRSGPALQMQREIQWFKAVEKIVHPKCKEAKNVEDKTPRELFTESHKELVKAGEKWAKDTAGHFTLVGTLIITIMFAAAFTIPGGNNQESGVPIFLRDQTFTAFIISDALSLFTSSTSVLLFIGVLTSRYAEKDFLKSLPWKLLFGLLTLFLSVVGMIVAFCSSLAMILNGHERIKIVAVSLGCLPVVVLMPSQLRLFLEILKSTARSK